MQYQIFFAATLSAALVSVHSAYAVQASGVERAVAAIYPNWNIVETTTGDLDGDGVSDMAGIISHQNGDDIEARIFVIKGETGDQFTKWAQSPAFATSMKGGPQLEIRKRSLFVYSTGSTCCEGGYEHLQFKLRDGRFELIGLSRGEQSTTRDQDHSHDVSLNLLTGDKIEVMRVGKKSRRLQTKVALGPRPSLDNFDFAFLPESLDAAASFQIDRDMKVKGSGK